MHLRRARLSRRHKKIPRIILGSPLVGFMCVPCGGIRVFCGRLLSADHCLTDGSKRGGCSFSASGLVTPLKRVRHGERCMRRRVEYGLSPLGDHQPVSAWWAQERGRSEPGLPCWWRRQVGAGRLRLWLCLEAVRHKESGPRARGGAVAVRARWRRSRRRLDLFRLGDALVEAPGW